MAKEETYMGGSGFDYWTSDGVNVRDCVRKPKKLIETSGVQDSVYSQSSIDRSRAILAAPSSLNDEMTLMRLRDSVDAVEQYLSTVAIECRSEAARLLYRGLSAHRVVKEIEYKTPWWLLATFSVASLGLGVCLSAVFLVP